MVVCNLHSHHVTLIAQYGPRIPQYEPRIAQYEPLVCLLIFVPPSLCLNVKNIQVHAWSGHKVCALVPKSIIVWVLFRTKRGFVIVLRHCAMSWNDKVRGVNKI